VKFLGFLHRGVKEVQEPEVAVWKGPVIQVASMCQHITGDRHKLVVVDLRPLVRELATGVVGEVIPLGGIQMGTFGIVLKGFAATDIWAVMRNVLWEDEHCMVCCGAMLKFVEPLHNELLTRCGPTIGRNGRSVTDEYWTD
jgi:hypothetical protein